MNNSGLFIPSSKIKLEDQCTEVECKVLHANFDPMEQNHEEKKIVKFVPIREIKVNKRYSSILFPILLSILLVYFVSVHFNFYQKKQSESNDYFNYMVNYDDTITITKYNGTDRNVVIPEYFNKKKVVKIADGAFKNSLLSSVKINAYDIEIGDEAFANSLLLQSVTGRTVKEIGENAFKNYFLLNSVQFYRVDKIKKGAFSNTKRLKNLDIEIINETTIDYQAFHKSGLKDYKQQDGLEIYNNVLINVAPNLKMITLSEKHNITSIDVNAFKNSMDTLESLTIDIKDITISKETFSNSKIRSLKLHPEINISEDAFYHLQMSLEEIEMPVIGTKFKNIFSNSDSAIKKVKIVGSKNIPQSYFESAMFEELYISPTINEIGNNAFNQCFNLRILSIPNYEKSLRTYGEFPNLEVLNVLEKEFYYTLVDHYIDGFRYLTSITFPENITKTQNNVINNLRSLREVEFPKNVEAIDGAMIGENCINLKKLVIPFIGHDVLTPMSYSELNKSHDYTQEVIVLKGFKMDEETFKSLNYSIEHLTFEGRLTGKLEGSLKNLKNIKHLEVKQNNVDYVGSLFTPFTVTKENEKSNWPKNLTTVILNGKRVNK